MTGKTYCINLECPFKKCDRHAGKLKKGVYSFAAFDGICREYLAWLLEEILKREETP